MLFHTFYCTFGWAEEYRSSYRGLCYIIVGQGQGAEPGRIGGRRGTVGGGGKGRKREF